MAENFYEPCFPPTETTWVVPYALQPPVFPLGRKGHTDESAPGWKSLANRSGMQFRSGATRSERPRRCIRGGAMSVLLSGFPFRRLSILMAFRKTVSGSRGSGSNFNSLVSFTWWGNILAWGWKSFEDTLQMCNGWTNRTTSSSAFSTYVGQVFEMQKSQNLIIWHHSFMISLLWKLPIYLAVF